MAQINGGGGSYKGTTATRAQDPTAVMKASMGLSDPTTALKVNTGLSGQAIPWSIAAPKSAPAPAPSAPARTFSGGSGGGTVGTNASGQAGTVSAQATSAPATPQISPEDWINSDAAYQAESAGYKNTLDNAMADLLTRRTNYDTDFTQTMKNLGWSWGGDKNGDLSSLASGKWDPSNRLGAYGSGLYNLNNDFASRGMLDSSFYGDAQNNFNTDFGNQFAGLVNQRQGQTKSFTDQQNAANNTYQNALAQARAASLARRDVTTV